MNLANLTLVALAMKIESKNLQCRSKFASIAQELVWGLWPLSSTSRFLQTFWYTIFSRGLQDKIQHFRRLKVKKLHVL